jgi:ParB family chromosome partitioning protein
MTQSTKKLTSLDEMFGSISNSNIEKKIENNNVIAIDSLIPYKNQPFKPYEGKRFDDMVCSIKDLGVLEPLIIRPLLGDIKYEILAGNNRWRAAKAAGHTEVPIIIKEGLTDEEAMLIVTETNLIQRSFADLSHSERAFVLSQHYEAIKSQGKRLDIINEVKMLLNADEIRDEETCGPVGHKLKSRDKTGMEYGLSARNVTRYLRINGLVSELKEFIDDENISIRAGVQLSYLSEDNQYYLVDVIENNKVKIDENLASMLHDMETKNRLNEKTMLQAITGTYFKPKKELSIFKGVKLKPVVVKKYFNEKQSAKEVEDIIDKALDMYFKSSNPQEE